MTDDLAGHPVACSWSGGKDSCLALHRAAQAGAEPRLLLTMFGADGTRSRSHGLRPEVLQAQAAAMDLPLRAGHADWSDYETAFTALLRALPDIGSRMWSSGTSISKPTGNGSNGSAPPPR